MKERCSCIAALPVAALMMAQTAAAQEKKGFAVNAGIGVSQVRDRDGSDTFNGNALAYQPGAEYRFTDHFALGLTTFGLGTAKEDFKAVNTRIEVRGFDVVMRFIAPLSARIELLALAGRL